MPRYRWSPNFVDDYAKLRTRINREYGEHGYSDKFREEASPGMLRESEADYEIQTKTYRPEAAPKEDALDRIERLERERIEAEIAREEAEATKAAELPPAPEYEPVPVEEILREMAAGRISMQDPQYLEALLDAESKDIEPDFMEEQLVESEKMPLESEPVEKKSKDTEASDN